MPRGGRVDAAAPARPDGRLSARRYTHQRTLDIRFADDEIALHRQGRIRGTAFKITNKQYTEIVRTHQLARDEADADCPNFNYGL